MDPESASMHVVRDAVTLVERGVWGEDIEQNAALTTEGWQQIDALPRPERLSDDPGYVLGRLVAAHAPILGAWSQLEHAGEDDIDHTQANLAHLLFNSLRGEGLAGLPAAARDAVRTAMVSLLLLRQRQETPNTEIFLPYATPHQSDRTFRDEFGRGRRDLHVAAPDGVVVPIRVTAAPGRKTTYVAGNGLQEQGVLVVGLDKLLTTNARIDRSFDDLGPFSEEVWRPVLLDRTARLLAREAMGSQLSEREVAFLDTISHVLTEQIAEYEIVPDRRDQTGEPQN